MNLFKKIFNLFFDFLERKDSSILFLEKQELSFWTKLLTFQKTNHCVYFFPYQHLYIKQAILDIKQSNNQKLLDVLCGVVKDLLLEELVEMQMIKNFYPTLIIGVPQSNKQKPFNQSEEIAKHIQRLCNHTSLVFKRSVLKKIKSTPPQHSLKRSDRLNNLLHTMKVQDTSQVQNKDIIIVDDVTTTGATFEEAVRALKKAGARKVLCIALAH